MAEEKVQSLQRSLDQALHENKKYYKEEQEREFPNIKRFKQFFFSKYYIFLHNILLGGISLHGWRDRLQKSRPGLF